MPPSLEQLPSKNRQSKSNDLAARARQHPEYETFMKKAGIEDDTVSPDDALTPERRAEASEERLVKEARLYWLRRAIGADLEGMSKVGEHLRKPQELAKTFGVELSVAEQAVTNAQAAVEAELAEAAKQGFYAMEQAAKKEIEQLENELGIAA